MMAGRLLAPAGVQALVQNRIARRVLPSRRPLRPVPAVTPGTPARLSPPTNPAAQPRDGEEL